jgi:hypothetical protein
MTNWRHEASKRLPEISGDIEKAKDVMTLWATITDAFKAAYFDSRNEDFIRRVYGFAEWYLEQEQSEITGNGLGETTRMGMEFSILNTLIGHLLSSDRSAKDAGMYATARLDSLARAKRDPADARMREKTYNNFIIGNEHPHAVAVPLRHYPHRRLAE